MAASYKEPSKLDHSSVSQQPMEMKSGGGGGIDNPALMNDSKADVNVDRSMAIDTTERMTRYVFILTILSALGGFLFGYDTGVISGAMILLKEYFKLNTLWQESIVSITVAGAAVFALVGGWLTSTWGRKPVIILSSIIFTVAAVVQAVAWAPWVLLVGRLIVGIAVGLVSMAVPVYLAENAPAHLRGTVVTVFQINITFGILVAGLVDGAFIEDRVHGWRYMLGLSGVPSVIQFFGMLFMVESPRFLISKQRYEAARKALCHTTGSDDAVFVDQRLQELICAYEVETRAHKEELAKVGGGRSVLSSCFRTKSIRRALFVGCGLQFFQQIIGINTIMYYSATILQLAGVGSRSTVVWLAALVAAVNFVCSFVTLYLIEKIGRRPLTMISLVGIFISLLVLAIGFQLSSVYSPAVNVKELNVPNGFDKCGAHATCDQCQRHGCGYCYNKTSNHSFLSGSCSVQNHSAALYGRCSTMNDAVTGHSDISLQWLIDSCPTRYAPMAVIGLILYLCSFAPGMGPTPWTINSEIYPTWARSTGTALSTTTNWIADLIISFTFLSLTEAITKYGAFYLYAGFTVCGWIFVYFFLPETKGLTLESVQGLFENDDIFWRRMPGRRRRQQTVHNM